MRKTNRLRPRATCALLVAFGFASTFAWLAACVGDDATSSGTPTPLEGGPLVDGGATDSSMPPVDGGGDAAKLDAGRCDPKKTFGTPTLVPNVNTIDTENSARLSHDGLTLYMDSTHAMVGIIPAEILVATRPNESVDFPAPTKLLGPVNGSRTEAFPSVTLDQKTLYFTSDNGGGPLRVYVAKRDAGSDPFDTPEEVPGGGSDIDTEPWIAPSGVLYFSTTRQTGPKFELWRSIPTAMPVVPTAVAELNKAGFTSATPTLTDDELTIYFSSDRDNATGDLDIWTASRETRGEAFGNIKKVTELSTPALEFPSYIDPEGCVLYFVAFRGTSGVGGRDVWKATKAK